MYPYETIFVQLIKVHIFTLDIVTSERKFAAATLTMFQTTPAVTCNNQWPCTLHQSLIISLSLLLLSEVLNCCQNQYKSTSLNIFYPTVVFNVFVKRPINFQLIAPVKFVYEGFLTFLFSFFFFLFFFFTYSSFWMKEEGNKWHVE